MPHCTDFTYSALPTELSCLPSSLISKEHHSFLQEKGGNFFKVEWEMQLRLPGITHEKFQQRQQRNKRATSQLRGTCCSFKLIRQDVRGSFTAIHIHHASSSFLTMKEVQKQRHTGYKPLDKHNLFDLELRYFPTYRPKRCKHLTAFICRRKTLSLRDERHSEDQEIWTWVSSLQPEWKKLSMNGRKSSTSSLHRGYFEVTKSHCFTGF